MENWRKEYIDYIINKIENLGYNLKIIYDFGSKQYSYCLFEENKCMYEFSNLDDVKDFFERLQKEKTNIIEEDIKYIKEKGIEYKEIG